MRPSEPSRPAQAGFRADTPTASVGIAQFWHRPKWQIALVLVLVVLAFLGLTRRAKPTSSGAVFVARRGPLDIVVLEGGSVQALESQEIKCEVRVGYQGTKILKIVEEGYQVTEDDIRTNKVLVELDSSDLQKQYAQQEIQYQLASASLIDAQQAYDIQRNQNLSDIKAAQQKARFAGMDFEKFLGDRVAQAVIDQLGLDLDLNDEPAPSLPELSPAPLASGSNATPALVTPPAMVEVGVRLDGTAVTSAGSAGPPSAPGAVALLAAAVGGTNGPVLAGATLPPPTAPPATNGLVQAGSVLPTNAVAFDFSPYADISRLGDGEAKQKIRELEDALQVAQKEEGQAQSTLAGTQRLFAKSFVTRTDLDRDEIAAENSRLKVQKATTARDLYLKYEFLKSAEEWLSKYVEATRELNRARKAAISKLAQAEAKWRSAQAQYQVQQRQHKDLQEQLGKCVIAARKPGLVVYGGGGEDSFYYGGEERIREGATVRERQSIITIPDMTKMSLKVKIPESYIKQVRKGQKARITVEAYPEKALHGEVTKVGVLPDSQNRWLNPDLKVYLTTITIEGTHDWLKPGMTAKVEIVVDQLPDVVYVPLQAVVPQSGKQICYVLESGSPKPRAITIGQYNDEFIEIKQGLQAGDMVLLRPPEATTTEDKTKPSPDTSKPPPTEAVPPPAPAPRASGRGSLCAPTAARGLAALPSRSVFRRSGVPGWGG
jgi:RND family efflux transporter MFP subunit